MQARECMVVVWSKPHMADEGHILVCVCVVCGPRIVMEEGGMPVLRNAFCAL